MQEHAIKKPILEISEADIINLKPMNKRGMYSELYIGEYRLLTVAVKQLTCFSNELEEELRREAAIMLHLNHPNIVRFFGIVRGRYPGFVLEFVEKGSLYDIYQSKVDVEWSLRLRLRIAKETGMALHYLHSHRPQILHRDLKSMNVLIDGDDHAKVCDFGLSKIKQTISAQLSLVGTMAYMAPEMFMLQAGESYGPAVDIFSYSLLIWGLLHSKEPAVGVNPQQLMMNRITPNREPGEILDAEKTPQALANLLIQGWSRNPESRPRAEHFVKAIDVLLQDAPISIPVVQAQPLNYREVGMQQESQGQAYEALLSYQKSIELGDEKACTNLGTQLLQGLQDAHQAHRFFKQSANANHPRGMYNLGYTYEKGLGTKNKVVKLEKARLWYQKAAEAGDPNATAKLRTLRLTN